MAKEAFTVFMFSVVIYLTWAINVDIPLATYKVARGDNITIPCNFKPAKADNPAVTVEWTAYADVDTDLDIEILSGYFPANAPPTIDAGDGYQGRVSLQYDFIKGIANLQLSSVTLKETRVFQCKVNIPGDKTGKTSDTTKVEVLVAPSKPICKIEGKVKFYQNFNLTCHSEEGTPTPTYQWISYDVKNISRPNPPKSTDVNGILSLYNISEDSSGYYVCTSANKFRSQTCNVFLDVIPLAPSKPICKIQGKAEVFQNINLTCYSEEGNPTPTYRWTSFDFKNISRPNPPKSIDVNGVLSLYDISMENTGYYVCTSTNKVGSQACIMTLDLKPYPINSWCVAGNTPSHGPDFSGV